MFTTIINKFLNTREHIQDGSGVWIPKRTGGDTLIYSDGQKTVPAAGANHNIHDSDAPVVIESIEFSVSGGTETSTCSPQLWQYGVTDSGYNNYFVFTNENAYRSTIRPDRLGTYGTEWFKVRKYDDEAFKYSFSLSRPIYMPKGAKLDFGVHSSDNNTSALYAYHIVIREV